MMIDTPTDIVPLWAGPVTARPEVGGGRSITARRYVEGATEAEPVEISGGLAPSLEDHQLLWIDVDVIDYPADVLRRLLATGFDIVVPNCVKRPGGKTFDANNWTDDGATTLSDRRGSGAIRLDAVGGTMLLVRADLHRDGLVFPPYPYGVESTHVRPRHPVWGKGEIETEGLGVMAADMGIQCWGLPDLEIIHADE